MAAAARMWPAYPGDQGERLDSMFKFWGECFLLGLDGQIPTDTRLRRWAKILGGQIVEAMVMDAARAARQFLDLPAVEPDPDPEPAEPIPCDNQPLNKWPVYPCPHPATGAVTRTIEGQQEIRYCCGVHKSAYIKRGWTEWDESLND